MEIEDNSSVSILNETLQKVAKGTGTVFIGSIVSIVFAFISRILIAKYYTQGEYGIFSLGYTILFISAIVGALGLQEGVARQIAYYKGKGNNKAMSGVIFFSLLFSLVAGITLFILLFSSSNIISIKVFHLLKFSYYLKIFSIAIPFFILLFVLTSIFRGFSSVKENVLFTNSLRNLLFLSFLSYIILKSFTFKWVIISYSTSIIISSIIFVLYFVSKSKSFFSGLSIKKIDSSFGKELIIFSLPLLLVSILSQIMNWTDTLMLGYFKTAEVVGLYNAALPLGQFVSMALGSMLFIYMPIVSELHAKNRIYEMKRSYTTLTKWLSVVTLPLVLIFVFFPRTTLSFLFGAKYILASTVLQILAIGFFINNMLGPNGATLLAMGKTRFLMYVTFVAAAINVILNAILIPKYGIEGAATATVTALVSINVIRVIRLYSISKIYPLEKNIIKPMISSIVLVAIIYFIAKSLLTVTFWMLPILFIIFVILYGISLVITRSFDREDLEMLLAIEKKAGINFSIIKRIVKRFEKI